MDFKKAGNDGNSSTRTVTVLAYKLMPLTVETVETVFAWETRK